MWRARMPKVFQQSAEKGNLNFTNIIMQSDSRAFRDIVRVVITPRHIFRLRITSIISSPLPPLTAVLFGMRFLGSIQCSSDGVSCWAARCQAIIDFALVVAYEQINFAFHRGKLVRLACWKLREWLHWPSPLTFWMPIDHYISATRFFSPLSTMHWCASNNIFSPIHSQIFELRDLRIFFPSSRAFVET